MKVSINQELRYSKERLIETFFLSNRDKKLIDSHRQITDIMEFISHSFSIIEIEYLTETIVNCFSITNTAAIDKIQPPFLKREFTFDYLPVVSKFNCMKCQRHTKDGICTIRGKKTKGVWKNCLYYIEKMQIKNFRVIQYT